jgi:hypothetical protein
MASESARIRPMPKSLLARQSSRQGRRGRPRRDSPGRRGVSDDILEINGWTIYAHPLFLDQLEAMIEIVEKARKKDPKKYRKKRGTTSSRPS